MKQECKLVSHDLHVKQKNILSPAQHQKKYKKEKKKEGEIACAEIVLARQPIHAANALLQARKHTLLVKIDIVYPIDSIHISSLLSHALHKICCFSALFALFAYQTSSQDAISWQQKSGTITPTQLIKSWQ